MARAWRYAELELKYASGHERPTRIRWSPPDPAATATTGMPGDPDPLTAMIERLSADGGGDAEELLEVHLLNVLGALGWELVESRVAPSRASDRVTFLFKTSDDPVSTVSE